MIHDVFKLYLNGYSDYQYIKISVFIQLIVFLIIFELAINTGVTFDWLTFSFYFV